MEKDKMEQHYYTNHKQKCRICFKPFVSDDYGLMITKLVETRFREVTQTILNPSNDFSRTICFPCNLQLESFCAFKNNSIVLQRGLLEFAACRQPTTQEDDFSHVSIKQEVDNDDEFQNEDYHHDIDEDGYVNEPEVKIEFLSFNENMRFGDENEQDQLLQRNEPMFAVPRPVAKYKCPKCSLRLPQKHLLELHFKKVHDGARNYYCDSCSYQSPIRKYFRSHLLTHIAMENREKYPCDQCEFVSVCKKNLGKHRRKVHLSMKETFNCGECRAIFYSYEMLQRHTMKVHNSNWTCHHCNRSFSCSKTLRNHMASKHPSMVEKIPCLVDNCAKTFMTPSCLQRHVMKSHSTDEKKICPECGTLYANERALINHIKRVHSKVRNFFCDICGHGSFIKNAMECHMQVHIDPSERRKWTCDICGFISISKSALRGHKNYEHSGRLYTCHCGKQFKQPSVLRTHIKHVHNQIKAHACTICEKTYFTKQELQVHVKCQHIGKDIPCEICGKLFATKVHLGRHRKIHEEPKLKCTYVGCTKGFHHKFDLDKHINTHEGRRDHLCHLCDKSYFSRKNLKRHLDVEHKAITYHCELCTFTNSRRDYLRTHVKTAHPHLTPDELEASLNNAKITKNDI